MQRFEMFVKSADWKSGVAEIFAEIFGQVVAQVEVFHRNLP